MRVLLTGRKRPIGAVAAPALLFADHEVLGLDTNLFPGFYDAYRRAGLTTGDVERGRYARISHIQRLLKAGRLNDSLHWMPQPDHVRANNTII